MDVIWNKKCAALQALTFYSLGQPENVGSHFIQFGQKSFSSSKCPHSSWKGRLGKSTRKIWLILFRNRGWKITLKTWNCPHIWSTSAFFCSQTKRTACTFSWTAGLVLIYLWTNFTDIDEKRDTRSPKNPCPANGRNFVTFVDNCPQPFCHLSPQLPFQEGGNYQSTPLLSSKTHRIHELNEEKHIRSVIWVSNWKFPSPRFLVQENI